MAPFLGLDESFKYEYKYQQYLPYEIKARKLGIAYDDISMDFAHYGIPIPKASVCPAWEIEEFNYSMSDMTTRYKMRNVDKFCNKIFHEERNWTMLIEGWINFDDNTTANTLHTNLM